MINKQLAKACIWILWGALVAMMVGCGGGANSSPHNDKSVYLQADVDCNGDYCEVEMVKDLSTTTATVQVCVNTIFAGVLDSVGTVNITRYELRFERTDSAGTAVLGTKSGPLNIPLSVSSTTAPTCGSFEIPVVSTNDKIFGPLSDEFWVNPATIAEFNCYLTVYGRSLAGQDLTGEAAFNIQCAAYKPYDDLIPTIQTFVYDKNVILGDDWNTTWTAFGLISGGVLTDPFGRTVVLSGNDFPVGSHSANTGYLSDIVGSGSVTFGTPQLIVGNPFGSVSSNGTDSPGAVTVYSNSTINDADVSIEEFFASKYSLALGEATSLTWAVFNEPSELALSPSSFNGVPVSFEGKDLSFDSVSVIPEGSVLPLLYAYKELNQSADTRTLDSPITVSGGVGSIDPEIQFFTSSHSDTPRYTQVALYWKITGDYEKVELFPINGIAKDVTGRESFYTPPLNRLGTNVFTLIVTGKGGSPIISNSVSINVTDEVLNEAPTITLLEQAPATSILNGTSGAFTFQIDDPENQDSTWRVRRIAGDSASYGPVEGTIPDGHGQQTVTFSDNETNAQGFITFEITAYDDSNFGYSANTKKTVKLVTYNTTDSAVNGPTIEDVTFTAGNASTDTGGGTGTGTGTTADGLLPGQDGVISFRLVDPAQYRLFWKVSIMAGDFGGTLDGEVDYASGTTDEGGGYVAVHYQDDPDSTDDAVVFKIEAAQIDGTLSVVYILKVNYITGGLDVLDFAYIGLHYAGSATPAAAIVDTSPRISFYLNYDGTVATAAGAFFVDHDGTIPSPYLFMAMDIRHGTGDPTRVADVVYERDFISPLSDNQNFGEYNFNNYYDGPGSVAVVAPPFTSGDIESSPVARWYNVFDISDFYNGTSYNLPITAGEVRDYQIRVRAFDEDNVEESVIVQLQIENNNPIP